MNWLEPCVGFQFLCQKNKSKQVGMQLNDGKSRHQCHDNNDGPTKISKKVRVFVFGR